MGNLFVGLLAAAVVLCWCDAAALALSPGTGGSLAAFCQTTSVGRRHLTRKLLALRQDIMEELSDSNRRLVEYFNIGNNFSRQQTMTSLNTDLDRTLVNLCCMGRALVLPCHPNNGRSCRGHRLYRPNLLPGNARHLRTRTSFRRSFQEALEHLEQLQAAMPNVPGTGTRRVEDEGCEAWRNNSALVLIRSYAFVDFAESLMEDVTVHCVGL